VTRRYFADSWFFIASLDSRDSHHAATRRLRNRYLVGEPLVTHDGVLTEVLAHFCDEGRAARLAVSAAVRRMLADHTVFAADRALFVAGLSLYERRLDKEYSLVDCMSMELMKARGITHVLTNDHHFRQEGFTVLSDAR
jgi:predicted nucleic acid-binding protein